MTGIHAKVVEGVLLGAPDGFRLVSLSERTSWRRLALKGQAADAVGLLHPDGLEAFLATVRMRPKTAVRGEFVLQGDDAGAWALLHARIDGRVTAEELSRAIRIDLDRALVSLREQGVVPTMSAEALMEMTRGGDHDGDEEAPAPRP